jgi:O-antigen/teichoic acid export membrane protein
MKSNLARNTGIYALSSLLPQMVSLLMMPLYTRFLSLEDFGAVALVVSFGALVAPFMGLQLNESFRRFYFDFDEKGIRSYFSAVLFTMLGISLLTGGLFWATARWWWPLLSGVTRLPIHPYLELGLCYSFLSSIIALGVNALVIQERSGPVLGLALFRTSLNVGTTVALVVFLGKGAVGMLIGQICGLGGALAAAVFMNRHLLTFRLDISLLREGIHYSLPMLPNALGHALIGYADRIILGQFASLREIGLYDFADRIAKVYYQLVFAGDRAVTPHFLRKATQGREIAVAFFKDFIVRWVTVFGFLLVGISLFSRHLLEVLIAPAYHAAYVFVPILCLSYLVRGYYLLSSKQLLFAKKTGAFPFITIVSGGINIVGNIILIPRYGAIMAAWTTLLTAVAAYLLARYMGQRVFPLEYNDRETFPVFAAVTVTLTAGSLIQLTGAGTDFLLKVLLCGGLVAYLYWANAGDCRSWDPRSLFAASSASRSKEGA